MFGIKNAVFDRLLFQRYEEAKVSWIFINCELSHFCFAAVSFTRSLY